MNSSNKHRFAFLVLIATSIYGGYIAYDIGAPIKKHLEDSPLVIRGLKVANYDESGRLNKKFYVEKLVHYEKIEASELTNPVINLADENGSWHITARYGRTYSGNKKVKLYGDVNIYQKSKTQTQEVKTDVLWYYPKEHLATTDDIIHYKRDNSINITSKGMRANLDSKHIELLHQVKATYRQNGSHEKT